MNDVISELKQLLYRTILAGLVLAGIAYLLGNHLHWQLHWLNALGVLSGVGLMVLAVLINTISLSAFSAGSSASGVSFLLALLKFPLIFVSIYFLSTLGKEYLFSMALGVISFLIVIPFAVMASGRRN